MSNVRGNTDASKRKALAKEALRVKIDGERQINTIETLLTEPWSGVQEIKNPDTDEVEETIPFNLVQENTAKLNGHFKLLGKVLPDLRAVEIEENVTILDLTDDDLDRKIAILERAREQIREG